MLKSIGGQKAAAIITAVIVLYGLYSVLSRPNAPDPDGGLDPLEHANAYAVRGRDLKRGANYVLFFQKGFWTIPIELEGYRGEWLCIVRSQVHPQVLTQYQVLGDMGVWRNLNPDDRPSHMQAIRFWSHTLSKMYFQISGAGNCNYQI